MLLCAGGFLDAQQRFQGICPTIWETGQQTAMCYQPSYLSLPAAIVPHVSGRLLIERPSARCDLGLPCTACIAAAFAARRAVPWAEFTTCRLTFDLYMSLRHIHVSCICDCVAMQALKDVEQALRGAMKKVGEKTTLGTCMLVITPWQEGSGYVPLASPENLQESKAQ